MVRGPQDDDDDEEDGQEGTGESKVKSKHSYIFHAGVNESIWGRVIQFALIVFNSAQQMCLSKINHLHLVENTHTTKHIHTKTMPGCYTHL